MFINESGITRDAHFPNRKKPSRGNSQELKSNHLLAIGINRYSNGLSSLNNAVHDAKEFVRIMELRYGVTSKITLYDNDANLESIISAFDDLRENLTKEDNLIIYFSGHGELVNSNGYWIPSDAKKGKRHTYLSNHDVIDLLKDLKAYHVLCIVDACFSGALLVNNRNPSIERYYNVPSRWVLTSGKAEVVPDGLPGYHSPFAKSLLVHLESNKLPHLSITELWIRMREGVISNSDQTPQCEAVKNSNHQGGEFFFIDKNNVSEATSFIKDFTMPNNQREIDSETKSIITVNNKQQLTELKTTLSKLLSLQKAKQAFELLINKTNENSPHKSTIYLRLANINGLEKNIASGVAVNVLQQKAQINEALIYIIDNLTEEDILIQ